MKLFTVVLIWLLGSKCGVCQTIQEDSPKELMARARNLIEVASGCPKAKAVPKYEEPLALLDRAYQLSSKDAALKTHIERLRSICYDGQAEYWEKREALIRWANLESKGDDEKAARLMITEAEAYEKKLDALYATSPLPKCPDYNKINQLLISIIEDYLNEKQS